MPELIVMAAEEGPGALPFVVAVIVLLLFSTVMLALLAFGRGREHS